MGQERRGFEGKARESSRNVQEMRGKDMPFFGGEARGEAREEASEEAMTKKRRC